MSFTRRTFLTYLGATTAATVVTIPSLVKVSSAKDLSKVEAVAAMLKERFQFDTIILDDEYLAIPARKAIIHCCVPEVDGHFINAKYGKTCNGCKKQTPKEYTLLHEAMRNKEKS